MGFFSREDGLILGHVYTYATAKLQPMITSEAGKTLIQTCLAKDEPVVETVVENPTTTLNNNDVICVDDNQRKKRIHPSIDRKQCLLNCLDYRSDFVHRSIDGCFNWTSFCQTSKTKAFR